MMMMQTEPPDTMDKSNSETSPKVPKHVETLVEETIEECLREGGWLYRVFCKHQPPRWLGVVILVVLSPILVPVLGIFLVYCRCCKPELPPAISHPLGCAKEIPVKVVESDPVIDLECAEVQETRKKNDTKISSWGYPFNYDCGIYWFSMGNTCSKGRDSPYFHKDKPTVLYVHGWEPGTTERGFRETVNWINGDDGVHDMFEDTHSLDLWIAAGYNVGIFYWNQYSDEPDVREAERKIYNSTDGTKMRWLRQNKSGTVLYIENRQHEEKCVSDLLWEEYCNHFGEDKDFKSDSIHIVGHSLGSQLALELMRKLLLRKNTNAKLPNRITLLDPFFSGKPRPYAPLFGMATQKRASENVNMILECLSDTIVIETYETSLCGSGVLGGFSKRLKEHTIYHVVDMGHFSWLLGVADRHICAVHLYFCSFHQKQKEWKAQFFNAHLSHDLLLEKMPHHKRTPATRNVEDQPKQLTQA